MKKYLFNISKTKPNSGNNCRLINDLFNKNSYCPINLRLKPFICNEAISQFTTFSQF